jgi:hypothetical protein
MRSVPLLLVAGSLLVAALREGVLRYVANVRTGVLQSAAQRLAALAGIPKAFTADRVVSTPGFVGRAGSVLSGALFGVDPGGAPARCQLSGMAELLKTCLLTRLFQVRVSLGELATLERTGATHQLTENGEGSRRKLVNVTVMVRRTAP